MRIKLLLMVVIVVCFVSATTAQYIHIETKSGSIATEESGQIKYGTFPSSRMELIMEDNTTRSISLINIKKVYFDSLPGVGINDLTDEIGFAVYPNPATNLLQVANLPLEGLIMFIYDAKGSVVLQQSVSSIENAVNVSRLTRGVYFVKIDDRVLKFVKL